MNKKIIKIVYLLIMFFISCNTVNASSFSVSVGSKNIIKGKSTTLTLKVNDAFGKYTITSSNPSVISLSDNYIYARYVGEQSATDSIKLEALNVGTSIITITPTSDVTASDTSKPSLTSKTIKITVSLPREKSTDNTLSNLSVEGFEISPKFNKDTLDYSVNVPEGTTSVKVTASATSKYASISGTGNKEVIEGINNLSVVVKSETGTERIYNLVVNVIDQNPINVTNDGINYTVIKLRNNYSCPELFTESEIVIDNIPIPACTNDVIDYTLVGLKKEDGTVENFRYDNGNYIKYNELSSSNIKLINEIYDGVVEGLKETKVKINDIEYQAFKFSNSSKYYIVYGINIKTGEKGLYVYDSVNETFSGYDTEYIDYLTKQNEMYLYVIIAFGCGLFLSIICIFLLNKNKRKLKKKFKENKNNIKEHNAKKDVETKEINEDNNIEEDIN